MCVSLVHGALYAFTPYSSSWCMHAVCVHTVCVFFLLCVWQLVQGEMRSLSEGIRSLLGSDHPVLEACAKYVSIFQILRIFRCSGS